MIASHQIQTPKIAIIGAGPGGLCLANILRENNIPFTVYESDKGPHERNQGGTLDIHPAHGQKALKEAGVWDQFLKHARPEADVMKVVSLESGEVMFDGNTTDAVELPEELKYDHRPELDREALQAMLFERLLEQDYVKFGKRLLEVVPADDNQYDLHFKDGSIDHGYDMVVGADGAWSHVRRILTDVMPHYSGITLVELWGMDINTEAPEVSKFLGAGSMFSFADGRSVLAQRLGNSTGRCYACVRKPESFQQDSGIDWENPESVRKDYLDVYFGDCGEDILKLMEALNDKIVPRKLYMLPVGFSWPSKPGVTLLGDAAHLMTPFAGVGVNAALSDAYDLGRKIVNFVNSPNGETIADLTAAYDRDLFPRGEMFAAKTYKGLVGHFAAEGNEDFVDSLREHVQTTKAKIAEIQKNKCLAHSAT